MLSQDITCLQFYNQSLLSSQVTFNKFVVVHFTQKADALAVFALCRGQLLFGCNGAHLRLEQVTNREHQLSDLQIADLPKKVGLILHTVSCRREPGQAFLFGGGGIVSRGNAIELMSPFLFKDAELDKLVTHHVGIGCQSPLHRINGVAYHAVPVLLM